MASADWKKMTTQAAGGIKVHFQQKDRIEKNHSNPDIDKSLSGMNYCIGCDEYDMAVAAMKARTKEVDQIIPPKRVRKDRVTCAMIEIPCPDSIRSAGRSDEFFEKAYDVLKEYFGEKNVHGGFVHKDEVHEYLDKDGKEKLSLEHIHVLVSAYTDKKGINGKAFETKPRLSALNKMLDEMTVREFEVDFNTHSSPQKKTAEDLKRESEIRELEAKIENKKEEVASLEEQASAITETMEQVIATRDEVVNEASEALARLEKYNFTEKELKLAEKTAKKDSKVPVAVPVNNPFSSKEYMKVEKSDWDQAQKVIKKATTMETAMQNMAQENATLKSKISGLEEQIGKLKKFIEKNDLLGKFKEFLKSLEPVSMAERIGAARKESAELERARKAEKVITKKKRREESL